MDLRLVSDPCAPRWGRCSRGSRCTGSTRDGCTGGTRGGCTPGTRGGVVPAPDGADVAEEVGAVEEVARGAEGDLQGRGEGPGRPPRGWRR